MKYIAAAALASLVPGIMSMTINTPTSVVQCQPQLISWAEGMSPYYLTIIPGGQASAAPIKSFDTQSGTSITWIVDIASGTSVTFALKDSTGATAYTDMVTIQPGSDSSCLSGSGGSSNPKPAAPNAGGAVATQAADATSSSATGSTGGAGTSSRAVVAPSSVASRVASTPSPVSATAQRTTGVAAPAGTSSTSSTTSGAQSRFNMGSFAIAGALGLLGAIVL